MEEEVKSQEKKEPSKKETTMGCLTLIILVVIIGLIIHGCSSSDNTDKSSEKSTIETTSNTSIENKSPDSLGLTPEEFRDRFNTAAKELDTNFYIDNINIQSGSAQDVFQQMLTSNLGLTGSVNKNDGTVRDVMIMGQGDGTIASGMDIIMAMGILMMTVSPELNADERGRILKELGMIGDNIDLTNVDKSTIRNNKKYWVNCSKDIGVMFGVQNANDE